MSLLQLQREFAERLRAPAATPWPDLGANAQPGWAVYRHAYRAQLREALRDTYARTLAGMGEDAFNAAADAYVQAHTPRTRNLGDYGRQFPQWLGEQHSEQPWLAELAWLDGALRQAFVAADAPPLRPAALASLDWEHAVLRFVPTLRLHYLNTNAAALWRALHEASEPPAPVCLPRPQAVRLWRQDGSPRFASMAPQESAALQWLLAGLPFGQVCTALHSEDPAVAGELLGGWLRDELLSAVENGAHGS